MNSTNENFTSYNCSQDKRSNGKQIIHIYSGIRSMNLFSCLGRKVVLGCALSFCIAPSYSEILFKDDFESAGLSSTLNGARWTSKSNISVSSELPLAGKHSARFFFPGSSDLTKDAWSELRFDLGKLTSEVWIQFSLFIPKNYEHRDAVSSDNNKILRLWGTDYNDIEKVGFCTWLGNMSNIRADWNTGTGIGPKGGSGSFITNNDLGKWMTVKVYAKAATQSSKGTIKLWKNGSLLINETNTVDNYHASGKHAYQYGYLLGWANSGFNKDTILYIDNVVMATKESELGGTPSPAPVTQVAPTPPVLRVTK